MLSFEGVRLPGPLIARRKRVEGLAGGSRSGGRRRPGPDMSEPSGPLRLPESPHRRMARAARPSTPCELRESSPYGMAAVVYGVGRLVAAGVLGWPVAEEVKVRSEQGAHALCLDDRFGRMRQLRFS